MTERANQPVPRAPGSWGTQPGRLLRITFESGKNFRAARNGKHLHVGLEARFCSHKERSLSFLPYVYDDRGLLDDKWDQSSSSNNEVWVYIAELGQAETDIGTRKPIPPYDLRVNQDDVCIRLHARNMALQGLTTKVVRIPASAIAEKLR